MEKRQAMIETAIGLLHTISDVSNGFRGYIKSNMTDYYYNFSDYMVILIFENPPLELILEKQKEWGIRAKTIALIKAFMEDIDLFSIKHSQDADFDLLQDDDILFLEKKAQEVIRVLEQETDELHLPCREVVHPPDHPRYLLRTILARLYFITNSDVSYNITYDQLFIEYQLGFIYTNYMEYIALLFLDDQRINKLTTATLQSWQISQATIKCYFDFLKKLKYFYTASQEKSFMFVVQDPLWKPFVKLSEKCINLLKKDLNIKYY